MAKLILTPVIKKKLVFILLVTCFFVLPYFLPNFWWKFIPSTIGIIGLFWYMRPSAFVADLGLCCCWKDLASALIVFAFFFLGARCLIYCIAYFYGLTSDVPWDDSWRFLSVLQCFNEEMIFRALLLGFLLKILRSKIIAVISSAVFFSWAHYAYQYYLYTGIELPWSTLLTLFFFGVLAGTCYFRTGNIACPFALHLGWNLNKFGEKWIESTTGRPWGYSEGFIFIEGNYLVTIISILLVVSVVARILKPDIYHVLTAKLMDYLVESLNKRKESKNRLAY